MLLATGDQRIHDIMLEAKKAKTQKVTVNTVHTDEESLYNLIERTLSEGKVDGRR
jgi:hypothetical protein